LFTLIEAMVRTGLALEMDWSLDLTPVDYVASAIVYLAENSSGQHRRFHLCNAVRVDWNTFVDWLVEYGYPLEPVPFASWQSSLKHVASFGDTQSGMMALMVDLAPQLGLPVDPALPPRLDCADFAADHTLAGLAEGDVHCALPTAEMVWRNLAYLESIGALPAAAKGRVAALAS
jgi:hypothetical protein